MTVAKSALAFAVAAICCAGAQAAIVEDAIGVTFPDHIGKMALGKRQVFEDARLGAVTRYEEDGRSLAAGGVTVGVYVYTGGLEHVSPDLNSTLMRGHFHAVIDEVKSMEQLGKVKSVTLPSDGEQATSLPGCGPQFLWERYEIDLDGKNTLSSATYLTSMKDHFVKLRISYRRGDAVSAQLAENFVGGIRKVLGGCAP